MSPFGEELKRATEHHTLRNLAGESGWGRSTIHEWMTGVRIPAESQLEDLLDVVDADPAARARLQQMRSAEGDPEGATSQQATQDNPTPSSPAPDTAGPGTDTEPLTAGSPAAGSPDVTSEAEVKPQASRRWRIAVVAAVALLAAAGAGIGIGAWFGRDDNNAVDARIVNTGRQGVIKREGPSDESLRAGSVSEGTTVGVVCLATDGQLVSSKVQHGRSSRVWALLDDGTWVSDLYLDTDKSWEPPADPPPPLRVCGHS